MTVLKEMLAETDLKFVITKPVKKYDGRIVVFDVNKWIASLEKAQCRPLDLALESYQRILMEGLTRLEALDAAVLSTRDIQSVTTQLLLDYHEDAMAKRYEDFSVLKHERRRHEMDINVSVAKLLGKDRTVVNENANKDSNVFNTQRDLTAGMVGKAIGLKMLPAHVANAHQRGDIHFHDLDYSPYTPMTNCCLIDFKGMLANGFKIGNADVESPKSIQTATAQIAQIIANVASSQYGGCTADRIDELLAPYAQLNYNKHLKDAEKWVKDNQQEAYAREKTQKTSMMLCSLWSMRLTPFSPPMDRRPLPL